jgi:hypothetical protein
MLQAIKFCAAAVVFAVQHFHFAVISTVSAVPVAASPRARIRAERPRKREEMGGRLRRDDHLFGR